MGEVKGGMIWENTIAYNAIIFIYYSYIIISETDCQSRFDAWDRMFGAGALVHPEGWDGEGGGKGVQSVENMHTCGRFMSMYGKTNTLL